MMLKHTITIIFLVVFINQAIACSPPKDYEPKPLSTIAKEVKNIVYGKIFKNYEEVKYEDPEYVVGVTVFCVLKGGSFERVINVTDSYNTCTYDGLDEKVDEEVILFLYDLDPTQDAYPTHTVNLQSAAYEPTDENFEAISRSGTDRNVTTCTDENDQPIDVPCFTADEDNEACSGAATLLNLSWLLWILGTVCVNVIKA